MSTYYKGAVHGEKCNSKTIPMNCRYCGQEVFYFRCDYGCKVFFQELGDPWTIHDCKSIELKVMRPEGFIVDNSVDRGIQLVSTKLHDGKVEFEYKVKVKKI